MNASDDKCLQLKHAADDRIGLEILHTFILDVLGRETPAAHIFTSKMQEDFSSSTIVSIYCCSDELIFRLFLTAS